MTMAVHPAIQPSPIVLPSWYGVHVQPKFERAAAREMGVKGIEAFAPVYPVVHHWSDREKTVLVDLFPGYIFTRFVDSPRLREAVRSCRGVWRILGAVYTIEAIPDAQIEAVQRILCSRIPCFMHPYIGQGQTVRVVRGSLRGLEGFVVRVNTATRLVISLELLRRSVAVEFELEDVELLRREPAMATGPATKARCG